MNVYFISGLGADKRAFERLTLPEKFTVHHLDWIPPLPGEPLTTYAKRLAKGVDTSLPFSLVGLSLGGMMASVLSTELKPEKTILISSIGCPGELPPLLKLAAKSRVYTLLPQWLLNKPNFLLYLLFGTRTKTEKSLITEIVRSADGAFLKWGIQAILTWKGTERPQHLFHIHGSADKILPLKYTQPNVVIENGSHFMVWTKAAQISQHLVQILE